MRGGWYFEGESRLFYYIMKRLHVSQAGLVLGNHADPRKVCPVYSIDCIIEDKNKKNIHHYIDNIFGTKIGGAPDIFTTKTYLLHCYFTGLNISKLHTSQQTW